MAVVLPAPLGPIRACSSPDIISRFKLSVATTPPNRLVSPRTRNNASGSPSLMEILACTHEEAPDAPTREEHDQNKHRAKNELPMFRNRRKHHFETDNKCCT